MRHPTRASTPAPTPATGAPSPRTRLLRRPARAAYDRESIDAILAEGFVCHVGFVHDGAPRVIPTAYGRTPEHLYLHGSTANRMLRSLCRGECCITVTLIDGVVLARSAFHQSANYRSVVVFGRGEEVTDPVEKQEALRLTVEQVIPGRFEDVRPPSREEMLRTLVVRFPLAEASAKVRRGGPVDDEEDMDLACWAGVVPLALTAGVPVDDALLRQPLPPPPYAARYRRPGARTG